MQTSRRPSRSARGASKQLVSDTPSRALDVYQSRLERLADPRPPELALNDDVRIDAYLQQRVVSDHHVRAVVRVAPDDSACLAITPSEVGKRMTMYTSRSAAATRARTKPYRSGAEYMAWEQSTTSCGSTS